MCDFRINEITVENIDREFAKEIWLVVLKLIIVPIIRTCFALAVFCFAVHVALYYTAWMWIAVAVGVIGFAAEHSLTHMYMEEENEQKRV
jgi:hypothetical protein